MPGFARTVARSLKSVVLRATGYHESQAALSSMQTGIQAGIASMSQDLVGRLDRQAEQINAVSQQMERSAQSLAQVTGALGNLEFLVAALHAKADTLQASQQQARRVSDSIEALAAALHAKADTLQASQQHARRMFDSIEALAAALHPKADTLQASQDQLRELAEASWGALRGLADTNNADRDKIGEEIDRLDSYLAYHARMIRDDVKEGFQGLPREVLGAATLYAGPGLDAVLHCGEYDVVVPTREAGLLGFLRRHRMEDVEPAVRAALRRHLRPGHVAIDAGANIGLHSIVMAQAVGPEGRLTAFEPLPHLAAALSRSLMLNGFAERCTVVQAALADLPGEAVIHAAAHSPVSSMFVHDGVDTTPVTVPRTSLDAHVPPGGRVDLIKMDIEGAEPLAWAGMARVVAENPGLVIILEWSASHFAHSGHEAAAFMRDIQAAGFAAWLLRDEAPETPVLLDPAEAPALEGSNLLLRRGQ